MRGKGPGGWWCDSGGLRVPGGLITSGRLAFTSDAAGVTILADPSMSEFAHGRYALHSPRVWIEESVITYQYSTLPLLDRLVPPYEQLGEIKLNPSVPWEIEFCGAISNLNADLRELDLRSLDLLGGASRISMLLSRPAKTTFIYITGGVRTGTIRIPSGVGISVQISGDVRNLMFDHHQLGAASGDTALENPEFKDATSRCEICIAGGASSLEIDEMAPPGSITERL